MQFSAIVLSALFSVAFAAPGGEPYTPEPAPAPAPEPAPAPAPEPQMNCSTGSLQCCNSVQDAKSDTVSNIFNIMGSSADGLTGQIGLTCSPLTGTAGGTSCTQQVVCCENTQFNGAIAIGCMPININL